MHTLTDRVAVITGASSGIGRAIALALADKGAQVCIVGRNQETLRAVARCAGKSFENFHMFKSDLDKDDDIKNLVTNLQNEFSGIDILIHSAGIISFGRTDHASIEDFDRQYRINVRAPYLLIQAFLPALRKRSGQIVFINSSAGLTAKAGLGQYAATKYALKAVADSLREEVNEEGIRIVSIYPGRTASPMQAAIHAMENKVYQPGHLMQPEDVASFVIHALNLPRTAEVTDVSIRPMRKT